MSFESVMPPYNASDPNASFVGASCLDFLLIELVPMAYRITNQVDAASQEDNNTTSAQPEGQEQQQQQGTSRTSLVSGSARTVTTKMDEDEERDAVFYRLETLGYRVGQGLVERFSRDRPRFSDTLDVIKFLCKDLWTLLFRKQVDNLKTNHRVRWLPSLPAMCSSRKGLIADESRAYMC
jgi:trafficking protein particle complex subunit 6